MAKSKNNPKKKVSGKSVSPQKKAAETRAKNRAIEKAKQEERLRKSRLNSQISYRNRRLRENVSILPEDKKVRERYMAELRKLYKEQNPKKNRSYSKKEKEHYEAFRNIAKLKLRELTNIRESDLNQMTHKQRKVYASKVKYYQSFIKKATEKVIKDQVEQKKYDELSGREITDILTPDFHSSEEDKDLIGAETELLAYIAHDRIIDITKNPFFNSLTLYINNDLFESIKITKNNRLIIGIDFQRYTAFIRVNYCANGTVKYDIETYSDGSIVVVGYCTIKGIRQ